MVNSLTPASMPTKQRQEGHAASTAGFSQKGSPQFMEQDIIYFPLFRPFTAASHVPS